jgi:hypothetical protein
MYGDWFCTIYVQCLSNLHILRYRIALSRTHKPTRSPSPWRVGPAAGGAAAQPGGPARGTAHLSTVFLL